MSIFDEERHYQRLQSLIDGLTVRTRDAIEAGRPIWEQPEPGLYELTLTKISIRIFSRDRDNQSPFIFELYNANGELVETVVDWSTPVVLRELYELVSQGERQKARQDALTEALQELDIPEPPERSSAVEPQDADEPPF